MVVELGWGGAHDSRVRARMEAVMTARDGGEIRNPIDLEQ
jgi:hypothetical protein